MICIIFFYKHNNYAEVTNLKDMWSKIFPKRLLDIKLNNDITTEKNYLKICPKVTTHVEMIFVDLPNVYSMANNNDIDQVHDLLSDVINNKTA